MFVSSWAGALPALALCVSLLVVPGLLVALAAGLRGEASLGVAPAASLGLLGVADIVSTKLKMTWGVLPVLAVTAVVAVVAFAVSLLLRRFGISLSERVRRLREGSKHGDAADDVDDAGDVADGSDAVATEGGWHRLAWYAACVLPAMVVGSFIVMRGIGFPSNINQTYDAPFHINAIEQVVATGSAAPNVVAETATQGTAGGFYPPLFHAVAALLVKLAGVDALAAANVVAVVIGGVLWPLSCALLVRGVVGRSRLGLLAGGFASVFITVFPAALLTFGILWPNALSLAVLPALVALGARLVGLLPDLPVSPSRALALGALALPGVYYAHPGAAFVILYVSAVLVFAALLRVLFAPRFSVRSRALAVVGMLLAAFVYRRIWVMLEGDPTVAKVRKFDWAAEMTPEQALGQVVGLGTRENVATWVLGALVIAGIVRVVRTRYWWLAALHVAFAWLTILAFSQDTLTAQLWTGFWYNDPIRMEALLAITGVPLAAAGVLLIRDALVGPVRSWLPEARRPLAPAVAGLAVLVVASLLLPGRLGVGPISHKISKSYDNSTDKLVSDGERDLYLSLKGRLKPGQRILGSPWAGATYAGVLTDSDPVLRASANILDKDRQLLVKRFKDFRKDPAVCAAVKRLDVAIVVEDKHVFWRERDQRWRDYTGLMDLEGTDGLTRIGTGDGATAYAVGSC